MKKMLLFLLSTLLLSTSLLKSQNPPCQPNEMGLTFEFNKLIYVPPLSINMPLDVIMGYIITDSVRHYATYNRMVEFLNRQTYNDTMRYIMRYYYQMIDYDPIRFYLYRDFGDYHQCPLLFMEEEFLLKSKYIVPTIGDFLLLHKDIIAHVKITDTMRIFQEEANIYQRCMIVTAEILDTIKGKVIPNCNIYNAKTKQRLSESINSQSNCLQFMYCLDWPRGNTDDFGGTVLMGNDGYPWTGIKPKLIDTNGTPWIVKDREYIVLLSLHLICIDTVNNKYYYTLFPCYSGSSTGCMYPIIDGIVIDPNDEFGFGINKTTNEFKTALRNKIQEIILFGND